MPSFMGFQIADDATSVSGRASSDKGFIDADLPLLQMLHIVEKKRGVIGINPHIVEEPTEIRDFLTWATGSKKTPLPPLARRILCLKRAIVKSSIASIGTSLQQRTGEKRQLEEIDALLRADGAINLDDKELCQTEGSRWVSPAVGGVPPNAPKPVSAPVPVATGCSTTVNCDNAALVELIKSIKESIASIGKAPVDLTSITSVINAIDSKINTLVSKGIVAPTKFKIGDIVTRIDGEAFTSESACRQAKVIGFEDVDGEQIVKTECLDGPSAPPFTPVNDPTQTPIVQRGGVASIRQDSPRVSLYKPNNLIAVKTSTNSVTMNQFIEMQETLNKDLIEKIEALTPTVTELKPFLTELVSKLVSKEDVTAQFDTLKQVIIDQTTKTIEPLLKELNEWKASGFQTSIQSITNKLDELKPALDEIPMLKKLVEDIRTDMISGGKTLFAKLVSLQSLLEAGKQSGFQSVSGPQGLENAKPLAIENAKPLAIENSKPLAIENSKPLAIENAPTVGALNELTPIIDSIAALRELITKLNTIKIEDIKALLETYKLGDTPALLAKLQSVLDSNTEALGTIKTQLDELKPQIDEIPALKTLVSSIKESMEKGADVSSQLAGLQTMLESYNLDGMNILLEEINSWLKGNTLETQLGEVKESLKEVISKLHEDPSITLQLIQTAVGELLPKLEQINTSLSEQLATIKEDTSVIKAGVEGLSTNSRTRDEELLAKIAEQTEMIADLKKNLGQLGSNISDTTTATLEGTRFLKHKIHNLKKLVKATHTPESEEDAIKRVLQTYDLNLSEKLAGLQASNKNGKNNVSIARIAELENLVAGLRERLQEETENTVSVREKETRIEELEEQIAALQRNSVKKNGKVSELTNQSADRQVQIDAKTDEIAQLKQEILDLRTNYDGQLRDAALAEEKLRNEISVLTADSAAIKEKLDEKSFLYDEQEESITRLRKEDAENDKLLSEAKAALAEITTAKNLLERAVNVDDAQLAECSEALREALQSKNEELSARNAKYKEMTDFFTKEMEDTIASLTAAANTTNLNAATDAAFKAKDAMISQLTKEKDDSLEELTKLKAEVQRLEKSSQNAKTGANSVKGDLTKEKALLESELARVKSELSSANTRIVDLEAELARMKTELSASTTRRSELEAELEQIKQVKQKSDGELYILKSRIVDLEREIGTLKTLHTPRVAKEQSNWNAYVAPTPNRIQLNPRKTVIDANARTGETKVSSIPYQKLTQKTSSPIMLDERSWQDTLRKDQGKSLGKPEWRGGKKTRRSKKINARRTRKQQ